MASIRFDEMSLKQRQRAVATLVHFFSTNHITDHNRVAVTMVTSLLPQDFALTSQASGDSGPSCLLVLIYLEEPERREGFKGPHYVISCLDKQTGMLRTSASLLRNPRGAGRAGQVLAQAGGAGGPQARRAVKQRLH